MKHQPKSWQTMHQPHADRKVSPISLSLTNGGPCPRFSIGQGRAGDRNSGRLPHSAPGLHTGKNNDHCASATQLQVWTCRTVAAHDNICKLPPIKTRHCKHVPQCNTQPHTRQGQRPLFAPPVRPAGSYRVRTLNATGKPTPEDKPRARPPGANALSFWKVVVSTARIYTDRMAKGLA